MSLWVQSGLPGAPAVSTLTSAMFPLLLQRYNICRCHSCHAMPTRAPSSRAVPLRAIIGIKQQLELWQIDDNYDNMDNILKTLSLTSIFDKITAIDEYACLKTGFHQSYSSISVALHALMSTKEKQWKPKAEWCFHQLYWGASVVFLVFLSCAV